MVTDRQERRRLKDAIQEGIATIKRLQGRRREIIAIENDKKLAEKDKKLAEKDKEMEKMRIEKDKEIFNTGIYRRNNQQNR